jgi:hypothetical protein
MAKITPTLLSVLALLALAVTLFAQGKGKSAVLHPR